MDYEIARYEEAINEFWEDILNGYYDDVKERECTVDFTEINKWADELPF